jgi:branched-chain amino acid transport system permease protein
MTFALIAIDGLTYGAWLFLVALGLTLVFGVMKVLNIAHGNFYAAGAYVAASAMGFWFANDPPSPLAFVIQFLAALVTGLVLGVLLEVSIVRRLHGRDEVSVALATFAVMMILDDVIQMIWGAASYPAGAPYGLLGTSRIWGMRFNNYEFLLIGLAVAVGGLMWWLLSATRTGRSLKALIQDREMAAAMGVPVNALYLLIFTLGAILAALGGAFTAPMIQVAPGLGAEIIVLTFAVVVIGGLGSIAGAAVGALLVGFARAATIHLYPFAEIYVVYAVMALVLAVRPEGLFPPLRTRKI